MYENIGRKIKGLAMFFFIVVAIAAVIVGIVCMVDDAVAIGWLVILFGSIVAYVSSWVLYGFGEIVDKLCEIERNTRGDKRKSESQSKDDSSHYEMKDIRYKKYKCCKCDYIGEDWAICPKCGSSHRVSVHSN